MQSLILIVREIVAASGTLSAFVQDEHFYLKIMNGPYMPLVIETWAAHPSFHGEKRHVSVAHYFELNGDLCADPDILMTDTGQPISFTGWGPRGAYYHEIRTREQGQTMIDPVAATAASAFATQWALNLRAQGFVDAALVAAER